MEIRVTFSYTFVFDTNTNDNYIVSFSERKRETSLKKYEVDQQVTFPVQLNLAERNCCHFYVQYDTCKPLCRCPVLC